MIYIGIDDTDNLNSKGTGHRARKLAGLLKKHGYDVYGVTRHQFLVSPLIPYTSHNSGACIHVKAKKKERGYITTLAREFMVENFVEGSDPGLCVAHDEIPNEVVNFGFRAKVEVLSKKEAYNLAKSFEIHLEEIGGSGLGVIGALSSVGLAYSGNDGRFIELGRTRDLKGIVSVKDILDSGVYRVVSTEGQVLDECEPVETTGWVRPLLVAGKPYLVVERKNGRWEVVGKTFPL
ncbi:hypothetical protein [Thermococcus sp.]|uniref:hypothetical protein n=1 Tax=Thermococcus sp. TaxID=35749 RepID=UPI0025D5BDF3|nr:hypothetical protein [Thermococcus sp.]